jgi:hypothetical protein
MPHGENYGLSVRGSNVECEEVSKIGMQVIVMVGALL